MADDGTTYRPHGITVWFEKMPEASPFKIESEFGPARTTGRGNSFDEADIYREALEAIMDHEGHGRSFDIAEKAIEAVAAGLMRGLPGKDLSQVIKEVEGVVPALKQSFA